MNSAYSYLAQLPPVVAEVPVTHRFAFEAPAWTELALVTAVLKDQHRMEPDSPLQQLLADLLIEGPLSAASNQLIAGLDQKENEYPPFFVGTRAAAHDKNDEELDKLATDCVTYDAVDTGDIEMVEQLDKRLQAASKVRMKVGARCMLLTNLNIQQDLFNGSFGTVTATDPLSVTVDWDGGTRTVVTRRTFSIDNVVRNQHATREQIPLLLAWSATIHKSQGQGFERGSVDLAGCFEHGQVYTALSRFTSTQFLSVKNFGGCRVHVDPAVRSFYQSN
jgi:ATP-dependent DNA helicase PIF1